MRTARIAVPLLAVAIAAVAASAKPKEESFADRLAAGKVVFAQAPIEPVSVAAANENLNVVRIPEAEAVANQTLARLIAAAPVPGLQQPTFFITSGIVFNCSAVKSGGAITCSHHVFETLIDAGQRGRDQLAFLLAHELAHTVIAAHRQRFDRSDAVKGGFAKAGTLAGMLGMLMLNRYSSAGNTTTIHPTMAANNVFFGMISAGSDAGETVDGIVAPAWSKENEAEADAFAIFVMQRAGYDPKEAAQLLGTVDAEQRGIAKVAPNGMLKKAGQNLVTQAVLSHGNPVSMGIGMGTGFLTSLVTRGGKGHYHDDTSRRATACAEQAAAMTGVATKPGEAQALFAEGDTPAAAPAGTTVQPMVKVAALSSARPGRRGRGRSARAVTPVPIAPKDPWTLMTERSAAPLRELTMAAAVDQRRNHKDLAGALSLCPGTRPLTGQLALACGNAQVAAGNAPAASSLFRQASSNPFADVETFRKVSLGQAALNSGPEAIATMEAGQRRYPSGQLYPDEIALRANMGDLGGARAAAARCALLPAKSIQEECRKALTTVEANAKA